MSDLDHKISDTKDSLKGLIEIARELEAENARLREALERIEQNQMCEYGCDCGSSPDQIARTALEGK